MELTDLSTFLIPVLGLYLWLGHRERVWRPAAEKQEPSVPFNAQAVTSRMSGLRQDKLSALRARRRHWAQQKAVLASARQVVRASSYFQDLGLNCSGDDH